MKTGIGISARELIAYVSELFASAREFVGMTT